MPGCPNLEASCHCPEHEQGLRAHAKDTQAYDRFLARVRTAHTPRLQVVTLGPPLVADLEPACTGGFTCDCRTCQAEKAELMRRGPQGEGNANPIRPARAA